jgi:hypothetical protein
MPNRALAPRRRSLSGTPVKRPPFRLLPASSRHRFRPSSRRDKNPRPEGVALGRPPRGGRKAEHRHAETLSLAQEDSCRFHARQLLGFVRQSATGAPGSLASRAGQILGALPFCKFSGNVYTPDRSEALRVTRPEAVGLARAKRALNAGHDGAQAFVFSLITVPSTTYSPDSSAAGTARTAQNRPSGCRDNRFFCRPWSHGRCPPPQPPFMVPAAGHDVARIQNPWRGSAVAGGSGISCPFVRGHAR